tara:strand:+ start:111 stop:869 length:759 start_codon:yes stop_codon:yes gene_type:complete
MELELDHAKLNFVTKGNQNNPPLVLWHGAGCTLKMWDLVTKELQRVFYTIAFDIRGAGKSINLSQDNESYTFERYSNDLNKILEFLDVERFHIWSMAWGTRAAIAYSSLHADRVISAVFSDASIGKADIELQKAGLKKALTLQDKSGIERYAMPEGWNVHLNNESARLSLGAASKFDLKQAFEEISFPFLVMTGDHDPNLTSSQDMLNHSDTGELRILKNVGHGSVLQRPDLTVKNFLDWHGKRQGHKYAKE